MPAPVELELSSDQRDRDEGVSSWLFKQRKWFGIYMVLEILAALVSVWAVQANHFVLAILLITAILLIALARYLRRL